MSDATLLNAAVIVVYLTGLTIYGSLFCKGQKDLKDFFLAGRSVGWLPVALSMIASNLSANTYLGTPALVNQVGLLSVPMLFMVPVCSVIVAFWLGRRFYQLKLYTVYEYLEGRFSPGLRLLGSVLVILAKWGWLTTVFYTPSLALQELTGLPLHLSILIVGTLATLYAALGGAKTVIWTDVVQVFVLLGGALTAVGVILWEFGGDAGRIWRIANDVGKTT